MRAHEVNLECTLPKDLSRELEETRSKRFPEMSSEAFIQYLLRKGLEAGSEESS